MAKYKLSDKVLKEISRPEILVEYQSIKQLPFILLAMLKFRRKKANLRFMCGDSCIGEQKYVIKPKFILKKVK
jgi:hypothetical protein